VRPYGLNPPGIATSDDVRIAREVGHRLGLMDRKTQPWTSYAGGLTEFSFTMAEEQYGHASVAEWSAYAEGYREGASGFTK